MTGTSSKSPMSGTLTSSAAIRGAPLRRSESTRGQVRREARGERAVDDAVVVGERQRDHQPRHELAPVPDRLHRRARDAEDRDLGRVDDRREARAAEAAEGGDRERPARHVRRAELALARLARQLGELARDVEEALLVDVADDRHDEALRRVGREAEVVVALEHELVAVERRVELREAPAATATSAFSSSATIVSFTPDLAFSSFVRLRNASSSVMSASSLWVTCGIITQLRCSTGPLMRLIRDSGTRSTSPNFSKSTFGQGEACQAADRGAPAGAAAGAAGASPRRRLDVGLEMRPLRPVPCTA